MFSYLLSKINSNRRYIYMLFAQSLAPAAPLLFVFLGRRFLGDDHVGEVIALIAKQYILSYLLFFGSEKILMRETARKGANRTIGYAINHLLKAIVGGCVANFLLSMWDFDSSHFLVDFSIYSALCSFVMVSSLLIGEGYAKLGVIVKQSGIYLLALTALWFESFSLIFLLLGAMTTVILLMIMSLKSKSQSRVETLDNSEKSWFYGESVLVAAQSYALPYVMSLFLSGEYITAFFAYTRIANVVAFAGSALVSLFYKDAVFLRQENIEIWKTKIIACRKIMIQIGGAMFLVGFGCSFFLFGHFSSMAFQSEYALLILGVQLINMAVGPTGLVMISCNKQKLKFIISLCGLVVAGVVVSINVLLSDSVNLLIFVVAYSLSILIPAVWGGWVLQNEIR